MYAGEKKTTKMCDLKWTLRPFSSHERLKFGN